MPDRTPYDIGEMLQRIEESTKSAHLEAQAANVAAQQANVELRALNGSVRELRQTVYGTEADRGGGLVLLMRDVRDRLRLVERARNEGQAIADAKRWLVGTGIALVTMMAAVLAAVIRGVG